MPRGSEEGEASPYALRASGDRPARENKKGVWSGCPSTALPAERRGAGGINAAPLPDRVVDEGEKAGDEAGRFIAATKKKKQILHFVQNDNQGKSGFLPEAGKPRLRSLR